MVSFTLLSSIAALATTISAASIPLSNPRFPGTEGSSSVSKRQDSATFPDHCTDYCSISAGCVCITRPTNCVANYTVEADETCGTVVSRFNNFTAHDLYEWNPELGTSCFGLHAYVPVCIGVTGYEFTGAVKAGDQWTPDQVPVPVMPGIVPNCTKFEYVDSNGSPTLQTILSSNGITKFQWNSWNVPTQDPNADWAEWAGYFNCVEA